MIRSWIGIVCVLVFVTTCVQTTVAQAHGNFFSTSMRNRVLPAQIWKWIEFADQDVSDRILSSDAYHSDFRFRAAPVKRSPNWQMPIVDVRSAKDLSITLDAKTENGSAELKAQRSNENKITPVVDWVWESSSDLAVRQSELSSAFDQAAMAVIPRPLPNRAKPAMRKQMQVVDKRPVTKFSFQLVAKSKVGSKAPKAQRSSENKITPVVDWVWESSFDLAVRQSELSSAFDQAAMAIIPRPLPTRAKLAKQKQMLTVDAPPATRFSFQLDANSKVGSEASKAQRSSENKITPMVDWVWESSFDLAVRQSELSSAFDQAAMAIIPRPLPTRAKPAKQKQMLTVDAPPASKFSFQLDANSKVGSEASKAQPASENKITPVVDWVWESSSDLAVRYSELNTALDQAAIAVIPFPLPTRAAPSKQKQVLTVDVPPATKFSIQLVPKNKVGHSKPKSAEEKLKLIAGQNDYWNYYAQCDRWNVVFAKPDDSSKPQSNSVNEKEIVNAELPGNQNSDLDLNMYELAALVADRLEGTLALYRGFSKQFQTSQN